MPEYVNYSRRKWLCLGNKYFLTSTSASISTSCPSTSTTTSAWHASTSTSTSTQQLYLSTDQVPVPVPSTTKLPHRYCATVSCCWLCSGFREGTETSSTLRRWSSARRAVWTHVAFGRFLYSVRDYGTLCLDCCVTLATTLLWPFTEDILSLRVLVHTAHQGLWRLCPVQIYVLLTYYMLSRVKNWFSLPCSQRTALVLAQENRTAPKMLEPKNV